MNTKEISNMETKEINMYEKTTDKRFGVPPLFTYKIIIKNIRPDITISKLDLHYTLERKKKLEEEISDERAALRWKITSYLFKCFGRSPTSVEVKYYEDNGVPRKLEHFTLEDKRKYFPKKVLWIKL